MKKIFLILVCLIAVYQQTYAYHLLSVTAPSGQTLYYYPIYGQSSIIGFKVTYPSEGWEEDYPKPIGALIIPDSVTYNGTTYPVTKIDDYTFANCTELTSIHIPDVVSTIGQKAFYNCSGITSINIPNAVTTIGWQTFGNCSSLTSITIGSAVTSIDIAAFSNCSSLTSIVIPSSVTNINGNPFSGCISLDSIVVESGNTHYDSRGGCNAIIETFSNTLVSGCMNTIIPNTVICIGESAFNGCIQLISIAMPNSMVNISAYAFAGCNGLISLTIPNSVTAIGSRAFGGCNGLTEITSLAPVAPTLGSYAFSGVSSTIPINIPCGSSGSYYGRWSYFSNFIEEASFTFDAVSADNNMGVVQILTIPTCTNPNAVLYATANNGYRFDHWSNGSTSNPYTLTVTSDTIIKAYFVSEGSTEGIDDVVGSNIQIYTEGGNIMVNGAEGKKVQVFDMVGRPVGTHSLPTGIYMVKVGTLPVRKVVVIR